MRATVPNHISAWGPGVLRSGDLVAHHTISFEHLSQENIFASPGRLSSSTIATGKQDIVSRYLKILAHADFNHDAAY